MGASANAGAQKPSPKTRRPRCKIRPASYFSKTISIVMATVMAIDSSIKFQYRYGHDDRRQWPDRLPTDEWRRRWQYNAGRQLPSFLRAEIWLSTSNSGSASALASNSAAIMEYEDPAEFQPDATGRQKVELLTITAMPSFAYKVNDEWSVSFGIPVMFGNLDLDVAVPPVVNIHAGRRRRSGRISATATTISASRATSAFMWHPIPKAPIRPDLSIRKSN